MNNDSLRYAGFWPRLGAHLLDILIMLPLILLTFQGLMHYRLFELYFFVPGTLFGLFYSVYLVQRFGGTPGKLLLGVRIRKLTGEPVGYREAILRYLPEFLFGLLISIAWLYVEFHISESEFYSLSSSERAQRIAKLAPSWSRPLKTIENIWIWAELLVLLTNRKRRALHDFIAGTVVVRMSASEALKFAMDRT